jgi:hypothetical protein
LALALVERVPDWRVTAVDSGRLSIEGTAHTRLLRFADDWVIRVRAEAEGLRAHAAGV